MISYRYQHNHDFKEMVAFMKEHSLYEQSYHNSRFKSFIDYELNDTYNKTWYHDNPDVTITHYSTVIAFFNDTPVGLLIFENYSLNKLNIVKFTMNKQKKSYSMLGFMCLYVEYDYRMKGIAKGMVEFFDSNHIENIIHPHSLSHVNFMCGVQTTGDILKNTIKNFELTCSPYNEKLWKSDAKRILGSLKHIEKHYYLN